MAREISVVKRDGTKVPYNVEKIQRQIQYACGGIEGVSESMIELTMNLELYNGITTKHIDLLAENAAVNLIKSEEGDTNYQYVAGRLKNSSLRKEVYGQFEPWKLIDLVKRNVKEQMYTEDLLTWYSEDEWEQMDSWMDHGKDEEYSHAALTQLIEKYLIRNKVTKKLYETPQVRYMIAAAVKMHAEKKGRLDYVRDYYEQASAGEFSLATPVLAGLGTRTRQFSSCVLLRADDSLDSIFATGEMVAKYAAKRAGIGLEIGRLRPAGSPIRNGEISHTGLTPFIKKWFADLRSCSQGGIRNASMTVTYPIWHYEFEELIVLKNNQGTEENRVRQLDYALMTNKYLWMRFKNKEKITLFDPNEVPDLYEAYYRNQERWIELYEKYEKKSGLKKKVMNAEDVFKAGFLTERSDTGRIYVDFLDNIINQGPIDSEIWPIYLSNLCQEILIPTRAFQRLDDPEGRIALCTLASINWGKFKKREDMRHACRTVVRGLNNVLDYQDFLSIQSAAANDDFKPLGVGVTNLAYWHAKRGYRYGAPEALEEVRQWMEAQAFYLTEASIELAKERGPCKEWKNTCYARGEFPWELHSKGVEELVTVRPTMPWDSLREDVMKYGIHNALLIAIAPVESSSVVIDSTNGIEMPMQLISVKESKAASLVQVVPEYRKLKNKYQLMWDQTDCVEYLKTAAVMTIYTDQSISTNTFYSPKHFPSGKVPVTLVAKNLMLYQKWGGKTIYYSLIDKSGVKEQFNELPVLKEAEPVEYMDDDCEACKL